MIEVMSALSCQLSGIDPTNPNQQCLGVDQKTGKIGFVPNGGGAIGVMDKLITMTFTMPIHTGDYVSYLSQNFGISKQAYAQGVGFEKLSPFLPIWVTFRNLVYLLFIIVFVVIGMFIMLRVQFDPRTVMTVQNQIPKLIIGIILVTFSFAIAGLMIDAMYIVIYFAYGVALTIPGAGLGNINLSTIQGQSAISVFGGGGSLGLDGINGISNTVALSAKDVLADMLGLKQQSPLNPVQLFQTLLEGKSIDWGGLFFFGWYPSIPGVLLLLIKFLAVWKVGMDIFHIGSIVPFIPIEKVAAIPAAGIAVGGVDFVFREILPWLIVYLIIIIAIFSALFKLWFELIKAYTFILFDIVLAPFWIISSLTPGNPAGFSLWIRAVLSNLSVFPTTIVMFLLGKMFIGVFNDPKILPGSFFVPPLIGNVATPGLIGSIIGLTVILTTPAVVGMVKNAFKAPNFPLTTAGKMFGAGAGAPQRMVGGAVSTAFAPHYDSKGALTYPGGPWGRFLRGFGFVH